MTSRWTLVSTWQLTTTVQDACTLCCITTASMRLTRSFGCGNRSCCQTFFASEPSIHYIFDRFGSAINLSLAHLWFVGNQGSCLYVCQYAYIYNPAAGHEALSKNMYKKLKCFLSTACSPIGGYSISMCQSNIVSPFAGGNLATIIHIIYYQHCSQQYCVAGLLAGWCACIVSIT